MTISKGFDGRRVCHRAHREHREEEVSTADDADNTDKIYESRKSSSPIRAIRDIRGTSFLFLPAFSVHSVSSVAQQACEKHHVVQAFRRGMGAIYAASAAPT